MQSDLPIHWFAAIFPAVLTTVLTCRYFWRYRAEEGFAGQIGFLAIIMAMVGASIANLFYHRVFDLRVWPAADIFDQVIVSQSGDVFAKIQPPFFGTEYRVQRYNCRGEFQAAFVPNNAGGVFKIAVNPDNSLSIFSVRTESIDTFSADGTLLQSRVMDDRDMPFEFLKPGPSVTRTSACEYIRDPATGRPAVKNSSGVWPLERGDWALESVLNRVNIIGLALFGGLMLMVSYFNFLNQRAAPKV